MPNTAREALETIIFYAGSVPSRPIRLEARDPGWWNGFDAAIGLGWIERNMDYDDKPNRREYRLLRKGYEYAKSIGLLL